MLEDKTIFDHTLPWNFLGLGSEDCDYTQSKVVVYPVLDDDGPLSSGPWAIVKASRFLDDFHTQLGKNFVQDGIHTLPHLLITSHREDLLSSLGPCLQRCLHDQKFIILLGNDSNLTVSTLPFFLASFPEMGVLQLGAHARLKNSQGNDSLHPKTAMRRISEMCPLVQAGIRSLSAEEAQCIQRNERKVYYAWDRHKPFWQEEINASLPEKIYITIHLDVFDPSIMPSVLLPEPGGLLWEEMQTLLTNIAAKHTVVGFDIVGLRPIPGFVSPDYLAAKLAYFLLGIRTQSSH